MRRSNGRRGTALRQELEPAARLEEPGEPADAVWARLEKGGFTAEQVSATGSARRLADALNRRLRRPEAGGRGRACGDLWPLRECVLPSIHAGNPRSAPTTAPPRLRAPP